jgi:hypothetical protein
MTQIVDPYTHASHVIKHALDHARDQACSNNHSLGAWLYSESRKIYLARCTHCASMVYVLPSGIVSGSASYAPCVPPAQPQPQPQTESPVGRSTGDRYKPPAPAPQTKTKLSTLHMPDRDQAWRIPQTFTHRKSPHHATCQYQHIKTEPIATHRTQCGITCLWRAIYIPRDYSPTDPNTHTILLWYPCGCVEYT